MQPVSPRMLSSPVPSGRRLINNRLWNCFAVGDYYGGGRDEIENYLPPDLGDLRNYTELLLFQSRNYSSKTLINWPLIVYGVYYLEA